MPGTGNHNQTLTQTQPDPPWEEDARARRIANSGRPRRPAPDPSMDEADTQEDIPMPDMSSDRVEGPAQPFDFERSFGIGKFLGDEDTSGSQIDDQLDAGIIPESSEAGMPDDTQDITQDITQDQEVTQEATQEANHDHNTTTILPDTQELPAYPDALNIADTQELPNSNGQADTQPDSHHSHGGIPDTQIMPDTQLMPDTQIMPSDLSTPAPRSRQDPTSIPDTQELTQTPSSPASSPSRNRANDGSVPDTQIMPSETPLRFPASRSTRLSLTSQIKDSEEDSGRGSIRGRPTSRRSLIGVIQETPESFDFQDTQVLATPAGAGVARKPVAMDDGSDEEVLETPLRPSKESVVQVPHSQGATGQQKRSALGRHSPTLSQGSPLIVRRARMSRMTVVDGSDDASMSEDEVADSQPDHWHKGNGRKRSFSEGVDDTQELAPDSSNGKRHRSTFGHRSSSPAEEDYVLPSQSSNVSPSTSHEKILRRHTHVPHVEDGDVIPESITSTPETGQTDYLTVFVRWKSKWYPTRVVRDEEDPAKLIFCYANNNPNELETSPYTSNGSPFTPLILQPGTEVTVFKGTPKGRAVIIRGVTIPDEEADTVTTMDGYTSFEVRFTARDDVGVVHLSQINLTKKQFEAVTLPERTFRAGVSFAFPDEVKLTKVEQVEAAADPSPAYPDTQVVASPPVQRPYSSPPAPMRSPVKRVSPTPVRKVSPPPRKTTGARRQDTRRSASVSTASKSNNSITKDLGYLREHSIILPGPTPAPPVSKAVFEGCIFLVTSTEDKPNERTQLINAITAGGGTIYEDFVSLFQWDNGEPTVNSKALGKRFGCVISNSHTRTPKYLQALSMGWPCLNTAFVNDVLGGTAILNDWPAYLLPRGQVDFGLCCNQDIVEFTNNWNKVNAQADQFSSIFLKRHSLLSLYKARKTVLSEILATFVITGNDTQDQNVQVLVHGQNPSYVEAVFSRGELEDALSGFSINESDSAESPASRTVLILNLQANTQNIKFEQVVRNFKQRFPWANIVLGDREWFIQSIVSGRLRQMIHL